jgi:probable HAF family extracellular repeat protein
LWWLSCGVVLAGLAIIQSGRAQSGVPAAGFMPVNLVGLGSPNALSADGAVIVGQFVPAGATNVHAFRWTEAGGQVDLGGLFGVDVGATSASDDGSVVVGFGDAPWRLTPQTGMVPLIPFPPGFNSGQANDVSAGGAVVVGTINGPNLPGGVGFWEPFRWTAATGYVPLGNLGAPQTNGAAVSADGAVVVGSSNFGSHVEAFRWSAQTGMIGLGAVPGFSNSLANDVSADGTVVVGSGQSFEQAPVSLDGTGRNGQPWRFS